jgi:hypothetical protein
MKVCLDLLDSEWDVLALPLDAALTGPGVWGLEEVRRCSFGMGWIEESAVEAAGKDEEEGSSGKGMMVSGSCMMIERDLRPPWTLKGQLMDLLRREQAGISQRR